MHARYFKQVVTDFICLYGIYTGMHIWSYLEYLAILASLINKTSEVNSEILTFSNHSELFFSLWYVLCKSIYVWSQNQENISTDKPRKVPRSLKLRGQFLKHVILKAKF